MSANNVIYIRRKSYEVFYQGCADNESLGEFIGKGKSLAQAVDIAQEKIDELEDNDELLEYGIHFIKT